MNCVRKIPILYDKDDITISEETLYFKYRKYILRIYRCVPGTVYILPKTLNLLRIFIVTIWKWTQYCDTTLTEERGSSVGWVIYATSRKIAISSPEQVDF